MLFSQLFLSLSFVFCSWCFCMCPPQGLNGYSPFNINITEKQLHTLNEYLSSRSYLCDYGPTKSDQELHKLITNCNLLLNRYHHVKRWYNHISSFSDQERAKFKSADNSALSGLVKVLLESQVKIKPRDKTVIMWGACMFCFYCDCYGK